MMNKELINKIEELKELEALIKEAEAEVEALKDEIKAEMAERKEEEMNCGRYVVRWKSVVSNRFDSTAFKKVMPDVYNMYCKPSASMRFTITG